MRVRGRDKIEMEMENYDHVEAKFISMLEEFL